MDVDVQSERENRDEDVKQGDGGSNVLSWEIEGA